MLDAEWEQVCADREEMRKVMSTGDPSVHLPVNLKRIIWNAQKNYGLVKDVSAPGREREELQAVNVIESVRSLLNGLVVVPGKTRCRWRRSATPRSCSSRSCARR